MDKFEIVKSQVKILDVVGRYARCSPIKKGRLLYICSPFSSKDSTPSCQIFVETDSFRCFSSGYSGDAISFVSRIYNIKNIAAAEMIARDFNIDIGEGKKENQKAVALEKQQLDTKEKTKKLLNSISLVYSNLCDKYRGYENAIREIGFTLAPNDWLLKEMLLARNRLEILLENFIDANVEGKLKLILLEEKTQCQKQIHLK
ncbi:MAG: zinc finger, CHC2-family protein [uncultured bacterium]|nr:MAG: zinc finger, CHC2-family protein [uncultured bacterium]